MNIPVKMKKDFELAKFENTLIVFAKSETVQALERVGFIKIITPAKYKGGAELIKLL